MATITIGTRVAFPSRTEGRLTPVSGVPIIIGNGGNPTDNPPVEDGDGFNSDILYFTPYNGNHVSIYKNGKWRDVTFTEISISNEGLLDSLHANTGPYDVFLYLDDDNELQLEFGPIWGTYAPRPANRLALQDGVLVKYGNPSRKFVGTIATVSAGLHVVPFLFWTGSNVNFISNYYNPVPRYGYGQQGYKKNPGGISSFDLSDVPNGGWQIPQFLGTNVSETSYAGHLVTDGDGIYTNWVCCVPRRVRWTGLARMLKGSCDMYGMGVAVNPGDDVYNVAKLVKAAESDADSANLVVTTEFMCPPGVWGAFMAFFAEGGSKVATVIVSDKARTASDDIRLTYSEQTCEY